MSRDSAARDLILDRVEADALERGFGALSVKELAQAGNVSRSGFFYHFRDRSELARAALDRFVDAGHAGFLAVVAEAERLTDDPLEQLLITLKIVAGALRLDNGQPHPGCLVAAACYQDQMFDAGVRKANTRAALIRRERIGRLIDRAIETYPPVEDVNRDDLADMLMGLIDGAIVISRVRHDAEVVARQVLLYRTYLQLLFGRLPA